MGKDALRIKHVNVNELCVLCNRAVETTSHVFLNCSFAKSCWELAGTHTEENTQTSFTKWATNIYDEWSVANRQLGAMVCWMTWKCRNDLVWNQKCMEVQEAANSARVVLSQWQEVQDKMFNRSWGLLNPDDGDELWSPPTENMTKVNTDATVFSSSHRYSFAFVARNHKGELLEARSCCKEGNIAPESAEAIGIREALSWIKANQLTGTTVETDCLVAVQAIRSNAAMSSYFGVLIQECRKLLKDLVGKGIILKFVTRSANNLAHAFVSCSYSVADRVWKANEAPPEIIHVLENDLN